MPPKRTSKKSQETAEQQPVVQQEVEDTSTQDPQQPQITRRSRGRPKQIDNFDRKEYNKEYSQKNKDKINNLNLNNNKKYSNMYKIIKTLEKEGKLTMETITEDTIKIIRDAL